MFQYLRWPFAFTALGLVLSFWLGIQTVGTVAGGLSFLLIGTVLAILEISLSFDNAIVNAHKLQNMTPVWRQRFLTWGILIAVFGMRIVFPLLIVVVAARIGPIDALILAANEPAEYAEILENAHISIAGFGGAFLMMVALTYFVNREKEIDWIAAVERSMRRFAWVRGLKIAMVVAVVIMIYAALPGHDARRFLVAATFGLLTFLGVDALGRLLDRPDSTKAVAQGGFGAFLYLEVLDASFSFDGVIGAFALTSNLFLIAIGLGIGAIYVRSMTIMLVDNRTLTQFRYLEHGAFWSILVLSIIMFAQTLWHINELVTGLLGAGFILTALLSSILYRRTVVEG